MSTSPVSWAASAVASFSFFMSAQTAGSGLAAAPVQVRVYVSAARAAACLLTLAAAGAFLAKVSRWLLTTRAVSATSSAVSASCLGLSR